MHATIQVNAETTRSILAMDSCAIRQIARQHAYMIPDAVCRDTATQSLLAALLAGDKANTAQLHNSLAIGLVAELLDDQIDVEIAGTYEQPDPSVGQGEDFEITEVLLAGVAITSAISDSDRARLADIAIAHWHEAQDELCCFDADHRYQARRDRLRAGGAA